MSGFAACGVCGKPLKVGGSGRGRGPAYVGADCGHVRRAAGSPDNLSGDPRGVDDVIARHVIHRLSRPDADDLLRPAPRPGTDARRLRAEARKLRDRKDRQVRLHAAGVLDDGDLTTGMRVIRKRLADIDRELADSGRADPLAEFRGRPAAEVWMDLGIARRRAVVQVLIASVIIAPAAAAREQVRPGPGDDHPARRDRPTCPRGLALPALSVRRRSSAVSRYITAGDHQAGRVLDLPGRCQQNRDRADSGTAARHPREREAP